MQMDNLIGKYKPLSGASPFFSERFLLPEIILHKITKAYCGFGKVSVRIPGKINIGVNACSGWQAARIF